MNDLNTLHVFLTLMKTQSTSRTAMAIGRSQSYVSKVLAKLREDLGDPLFLRDSTGLTPTTYAVSIEPKISAALGQLNQALEPEKFDPRQLEMVTLHIAEPYLVTRGKAIIQAIRSQTNAVIDIRTWGDTSESLILQGEVDLGLHVLSDKPQSFYQKRLHRGSGAFVGNVESKQYVKFVVPGVNDQIHHFHKLDPTIEPQVFVDNYQLMSQLMDEFYTLQYSKVMDNTQPDLSLEVALIMKSSRRYSPQTQWLCDLVTPILNQE
ncbi:LysR family transcriptional regulator [Vibrio splendidus]|uniref:LysR family transcriptional regulator n=1 Tax=Vibrio splendidus TaxID=29497 RepID=UPI000769BF08|nr:LysR family transcriptional regulator [Vibrio splendidus]PHX05306.1 HTH-type transcriptional regulator YidZ [Vibrio splendidus]